MNRREFFQKTGLGLFASGTISSTGIAAAESMDTALKETGKRGSQRLTIERLQKWEALQYGMFIHIGMHTFDAGNSYPPGRRPAALHNPENLDVDQWISVARDAGMKYAVLTAKEDGFCLWPSKHTDYTVANSSNETDIVEKFVSACRNKDILPGLYFNSMDPYHLYGSLTRYAAKRNFMPAFPRDLKEDLPPYTTSVYQTFMTAQITELIQRYGPISHMWIDLPGELGTGYRTFIYNHMAQLQPDSIIMMNTGVPDCTKYDYHYAFPSDLIAIERGLPPEGGYPKWRTIEGKEYYIPGEVCDPIGNQWYHLPPDPPRGDEILLGILQACRQRGVNLLLDVPPSKKGLIPDDYVQALMRLRKNANI